MITVVQSTPVLTAWELMAKRGIRHLPVLDLERRLIGLVSDRDLRQAILDRALQQTATRTHADLGALRVSDVMTWGVLTVGPDTGVRQAAHVMRERGLGALPVAEEAGLLASSPPPTPSVPSPTRATAPRPGPGHHHGPPPAARPA